MCNRIKLSAGRLLFVALLLALGGAAFVFHQRDQASQALIVAVNAHDASRVEALLNQGADPNVRDWKTYYPGGGVPFRPPWYEKYLAKLMHRKPRPADPYVGPTVLMIAADHGDTAMAQSLLNHGADITKTGTELEYTNSLNDDNPSYYCCPVPPLWEAAKNANINTVKLLIKRGAPVEGRGRGLTPLLLTDNLEITKALLDARANINATDEEPFGDVTGKTQLHRAVTASESLYGDGVYCAPGLGLAHLLLARGAKVDPVDDNGNTPLMDACDTDSIDGVKLLLAHGANINACNNLGRSALFDTGQDLEVLKFLLAHGANVNIQDHEGRTVLMDAAEQGDTDPLDCLLAHGANVNAQDKKGETALMLASHLVYSGEPEDWQEQRLKRLRLLRQYGANPNLKDKQGRTAAAYFNPEPPDPPGS